MNYTQTQKDSKTLSTGMSKVRILHLEDDADFSALVKSLLEKEDFASSILAVDNFSDFVTALDRSTFDLILADYQLPTCNGMQSLSVAREKAGGTPFVLVSGAIGEESAIESLKSGATDYVLKNSINRLVPAIRRALHESQERKRASEELSKAQEELLRASRMAGMAEVATSVLHNIGNVLSSINISVSLLCDDLRKSRIANISHVAVLVREHENDLADFMTRDLRGRQLPEYLSQLAEHLSREQADFLREMEEIRKNVEHIKNIVAFQQGASNVSGTSETVSITNVIEDALRLNAGTMMLHEVQIVREYAPQTPELTLEKHKLLQILVNLIHNAKQACDESGRPGKRVTLRVSRAGDRMRIEVIDNGVGIPPENLSRIFDHGFTTRKDGHGFGLYSSASAAKSMGAVLSAQSEGPGKGATFTLDLPTDPPPR